MTKKAPIVECPDLFIVPTPAHPRQYVTVKETGQRGYVWDGVSLDIQKARDYIGIVLDGHDGPMPYYHLDELKEETQQ